jgi:hypothetical protein
MLRRTFLKFLGVTPTTPILGHLLPKEVAKKFKIIHMAEIIGGTDSGSYPFDEGNMLVVDEAKQNELTAKHGYDSMQWFICLKGKDGKTHTVSRQEEIK